jgi:hypothetical protein
MARQRKAAQEAQETPTQDSAPDTGAPAADAAPERQPGDEPAEARRPLGPDPFTIDTDPAVGARLQGGRRSFDRDLGRYAFRDVQIRFDEKPDQPLLDKLREKFRETGFEWKADKKAWVKTVPQDEAVRARVDAERLFQEVVGMLREARGLGPAKAPF